MFGQGTHLLLEAEETRSLVYGKAEYDQVRLEQSPGLRAGGIVELEAVLSFARADVKDERLVHVPEELDGDPAGEVVTPPADPPGVGY